MFAPLFARAQGDRVVNQFSLQECVDYALVHNEEYLNAGLEAKAQKTFVGEVLSDGLPQINGSININNNFKVPTTFIPAIFFGGPSDEFIPVQFQTQYNGSASVTVSQLVLDGSYFLGVKAARTYTQLSAKDAVKSKIDLISTVSKAYYSVLVNKERLDLLRTNFASIDSLLHDTELLYENGFAEKIDVNRIRVQYNNLNTEVENAQRGLAASYLILKFQLSMPDNEDLILTDALDKIEFAIDENLGSDFQYGDRIEYSTMNTSLELAHMDLKNIKVGYLPKLDAFATLGATAGTGSWGDMFQVSNNWYRYGLYGFSLSIPVFDGFRKSNQMQKRRIIIQQRENMKDRLERAIDLEINQAKIGLANSINKMNAQKENMELAKEVFEVTRSKYQQGVGSNLEVVDAETSYKNSQTNYYSALYEALIARIDYQKALGKLD